MYGGKKYDFKALFRLLRFASDYRKQMLIGLGLSVLLAVLDSARPYLTKIAVDDYILQARASGFLLLMLIMTGLLLVQALFQYAFAYLANWLGQRVIRDLRVKLFAHMLYFRLKYFDDTPVGLLVTRSVNDIETIAVIFSDGVLVVFGDLLRLVVIVGVMLYMNWRLSLVVFAIFPVLYWIMRWFQRAIKRAYESIRSAVARLNTFVQERLSAMHIVQLFNREQAEYEKFSAINAGHRDAQIRMVLYFSFFFPIINLLASIALGLIIWYGCARAVLGKAVSIGDMVAFISFVQLLFRPMRQIADRFNTMQNGLLSAARVWRIIDLDETLPNRGTHAVDKASGGVCFRDVHFSYVEGEPVLKGVTFEVRPGETLAIVGATGSGKSTIANLLLRFYDVQKGSISIDGVALKDWDLKNLRKHIAIVLQDIFLFSDSIYRNVVLELDVSLERVVEAAREIGIHDFIAGLPGGYGYDVRERGVTLSVGQRQLLSLLRAYVCNASILILDEATSSVDPNTEERVQRAIDRVAEGRTSIIIAHRLASVQNADKIMVMHAGKVVETGTPGELLHKKNGVYRKLFETQFESFKKT